MAMHSTAASSWLLAPESLLWWGWKEVPGVHWEPVSFMDALGPHCNSVFPLGKFLVEAGSLYEVQERLWEPRDVEV